MKNQFFFGKKLLSGLLVLFFLGGTITTIYSQTVRLGDVNGNGVADIVDAMQIAQYSANITPKSFISSAADVNCDSKININDALMVARYSAGLISSFPCEPTNSPTPTPTPTQTNALADYDKLFDLNTVHQVEIRISRNEFDRMIQDMIAYDAKYHEEWMTAQGIYNYKTDKKYHADFVYTGTLGEYTIEDVGFRTKGSYWSRKLPYNPATGLSQRTHFNVDFNETFDLPGGTDEYNNRDNRKFASLKKILLKCTMNDNIYWVKDATQIRFLYTSDLYARAGITVPRVAKAKLYLNIDGKKIDYGLYTLEEPIDKTFLTKRYGKDGNNGNLYKCTANGLEGLYPTLSMTSISSAGSIGVEAWETNFWPPYDLKTNEKTADHSQLISFINALNNLEGSSFIDYIDNNFDVSHFLKCMAMEVLTGNPDGYFGNANNYYLYFHTNGKIILIPFDLDNALAGKSFEGNWGKDDANDTSPNYYSGWCRLADLDIYNGPKVKYEVTPDRPLADKILAIPKYSELYKKYLKEFIDPVNKLFNRDDFMNRFNTYYSIYHTYVANSILSGEQMQIENTVSSGEDWRLQLSLPEYLDLKITSIKRQTGY